MKNTSAGSGTIRPLKLMQLIDAVFTNISINKLKFYTFISNKYIEICISLHEQTKIDMTKIYI